MFEILEVIGFILKLIFRIIFEIILYNIGHYTIRIITLGNYSKKNCRWVNRKTQGRNRNNNRILTFNGMKKCVSEWNEYLKLPHATIQKRLQHGWSVEKSLSTPLLKIYKKHARKGSSS